MSRHRIVSWLKRVLGLGKVQVSPPAEVVAPIAVERSAAETPKIASYRPLAGQLASQAHLNVRKGRKPRSKAIAPRTAKRSAVMAKPVKVAAAPKRLPKPTSVHLQARHLAAKTRLQAKPNVIPLCVADTASSMEPRLTRAA